MVPRLRVAASLVELGVENKPWANLDFGIESTVRASLALYNTCEDIDALVAALRRLQVERRHRS